MVSLPSPKYSLCREVGKVKILKSSLSIVHSTFTLQGVNIFCQSFKTQKGTKFKSNVQSSKKRYKTQIKGTKLI